MYQRLLLVLDAEQESSKIIINAVGLAKQLGASLHALVVASRQYESVCHYHAELNVCEYNAGHSKRKCYDAEVLRTFHSLATDEGVTTTGEVVDGFSVLKIVRNSVQKTSCDAIVMSSYFRPALPDLLLGTKAQRLAREGSTPLILFSSSDHEHRVASIQFSVHGLGFL